MITLLLSLTLAVSNMGATCPRPLRSSHAVSAFRKSHPCPITGKTTGACPGWAVDHVVPLACCGPDVPENMRWLENDLHALRHKQGLGCARFPQPVRNQ